MHERTVTITLDEYEELRQENRALKSEYQALAARFSALKSDRKSELERLRQERDGLGDQRTLLLSDKDLLTSQLNILRLEQQNAELEDSLERIRALNERGAQSAAALKVAVDTKTVRLEPDGEIRCPYCGVDAPLYVPVPPDQTKETTRG